MSQPILVPPLGQTTDTVVLTAWYKQIGQSVKVGEPLFAIETDKATLDIEAQDSGVLLQVMAQPGDEVKVLSSIGLVGAVNEQPPLQPSPGVTGEGERPAPQTPVTDIEYASPEKTGEADRHETSSSLMVSKAGVNRTFVERLPENVQAGQKNTGQHVMASPRARRLAQEFTLDWHKLNGSGPGGNIVERDVRNTLRSLAESYQVAPQAITDAPPAFVPTRQAQLLAAQVDFGALLDLSQIYEGHGIAVTPDSLVLYVVAQVAGEFRSLLTRTGELSVGYVAPLKGSLSLVTLGEYETRGLMKITKRLEQALKVTWNGDMVADDGRALAIVCACLGPMGVDMFTPLIQVAEVPIVSMGQLHKTRSGESLTSIALSYARTMLPADNAAHLLQQIVQRVEDPDLLF